MPNSARPTYTLKGDTGRFALTGAKMAFRVRTPPERVREVTAKAIDERLAKLDPISAAAARAVADRQKFIVDRALEALSRIDDPNLREVLRDGIGAAYHCGLLHFGGPALKIERYERPHRASRMPHALKSIIENRAVEYRKFARKAMKTDSNTANNIWKLVASEIDKLPEAPYRWKRYYRADLGSLADENTLVKDFVAAIAKALGRLFK